MNEERIAELRARLRHPIETHDSGAVLVPETPEQWQDAVNAASVLLLIDSARQYELVTGGPPIVGERCEDILELGKLLGYEPDASQMGLLQAP